MLPTVRKQLVPGVHLTYIKSEKFKTSLLSVTMLAQLSKKEAAQNALLMNVLCRGTARYPDMLSLNSALASLYGVQIMPVVRKKGDVHAVGLMAELADDRFVPGNEPLLEKTAALLGEMLLSPKTWGGRLDREFVESERIKLADEIRSLINDRRQYALSRLAAFMFKGQGYAVSRLGAADDAESVSVAAVTKQYKRLLAEAPIEVFYCGSIPVDLVETMMIDALATIPRMERIMPDTVPSGQARETVKEFAEYIETAQANIAIGYKMPPCTDESSYASTLVFNALFGAGAGCRLFTNVREKLSLCYQIDSTFDPCKGFLAVSAGISPENKVQMMDEVQIQLEAIKNKEFSDDELESAKISAADRMFTVQDDQARMENYALDALLLHLGCTADELGALCMEVTADEVAAVAASLAMDSVYILTRREEENDEA